MDPEHLRPALGEDPDETRSDRSADDDQGDDEPVGDAVQVVEELVEPLVPEADFDLTVEDPPIEEVIEQVFAQSREVVAT